MSDYVIAIARADGGKVLLKPGGQGERDLIESVADAVVARPVGVLASKAQVRAAVVESMRDVLREMKSEVLPR